MEITKSGIKAALVAVFLIGCAFFVFSWQDGQAQSQTAKAEDSVKPNESAVAPERETVYQLSPLKALLEGALEGNTPFSEVARHGDFGIGTVNPLDGEVIMLDGKIWKATVDGKAKRLRETDKTPLMTVTFFDAEREIKLGGVSSFADLGKQLDAQIGSPNLIYAVRIRGEFEYLRLRSVPPQKRPFPRLTEVLKKQAFFEHPRVRGTMVGFRMPAFAGGVNAPGYHFHFITADETEGGHVLDIKASNITAAVDASTRLLLDLQPTEDFLKADLSCQESNELQNLVQPGTAVSPTPR